ncbi:MAG: oligopeptide/dipeptide ABC transporter ATP-binding protein, partial [Desulfatiglandales bacterium]
QLFDIFLNFKEAYGVTILFITHNLSAANYLCDRVGVLYKGHLVELGRSQEILTRPYHPYTMALLDAVPKFGRCDIPTDFGTLQRQFEGGDESLGCPFFKRCQRAKMVRCSNELPVLLEVEPGHFSSCFYGKEIHKEVMESAACRLGI